MYQDLISPKPHNQYLKIAETEFEREISFWVLISNGEEGETSEQANMVIVLG